MIHHAVLRLSEVCAEVIVVIGPDHPEPFLPAGLAVRLARDETEGEGPLAGVRAGLAVVRSGLALIAGGDMPDLQPAVLREMLRVAVERSALGVALADGERFRPLPCVVRSEPALEAAATLLRSGRRRLRDLLEELGVAVIDESTWLAPDPARRTLFDVDEVGDLERW